jgi:CMP-N,N'-diacetyllegionaminic acid synthase
MILGLIAARAGSKGVPGKNLKYFPNALECSMKVKEFDKVVVSSDDTFLLNLCQGFPVNPQPRPPELATDTASKWDVFRYVANQNELKPDDILVDLDVGCPLRAPKDVSECIMRLGDGGFDVVATAYESDRNPYFNMVEADWNGYVQMNIVKVPPTVLIGNDYICTCRQNAPNVYSLSPAVFAIRAGALLAFEHWSQARMGIVVIPRERAWDVDTPLDFEIVEFLMGRK